MRGVIIGVLVIFCVPLMVLGEGIQTKPDLAPKLSQVVGENEAILGPTHYPDFYAYSSDNPVCGEYLKVKYDPNAVVGKISTKGFSLAPLWLKSKHSGTPLKPAPLLKDPGYQPIPGLKDINVDIPAEYTKTANILITWTVRIEGERTAAYSIWPDLCDAWHGTTNQSFPGGDVKTALFINDEQKGSEAIMTIPDGGVTSSYQPNDPTHTGSYLLTAASYANGELPRTIKITVKWYNDTCMLIKSPKNMRNVIVTVVPIERTTSN